MNQPISDIFSSQDTTKLLTFVVPPTRFIADATVPHSLVQNQYENLLAMVQKNVQDIRSLQLETMSLKNVCTCVYQSIGTECHDVQDIRSLQSETMSLRKVCTCVYESIGTECHDV